MSRLAPVGALVPSLLATMTTARNHRFRDLLRYRPDGSAFMPCQAEGVRCAGVAVDPGLYCARHADLATAERLRRIDAPKGDALAVETRARNLAAEDGRPDQWRRYLPRAREWNESAKNAGKLDDVV